MYRLRIVVVLASVVAVLSMAGQGLAASGDIVLASTSDTGTKGNGHSQLSSLSADGTRVAFHSGASNLDPADTDANIADVYVKDLTTGDIVLASTSDSGTKGNNDSAHPSLSADGSRVAFFSYANNLDPSDTDTDAITDIYVKDLTTGDIVLASTSDTGTKGNGYSFDPSLSADGTRVAFFSSASNLDPNDMDAIEDVYVKDLTTGDIVLASTSDTGTKGNGYSFDPSLSADGTRVAFRSGASNLDPADTEGASDIYVKDLTTGDIVLASASDTGANGNGHSLVPSLSADGTRVALYSSATNLDPADMDGIEDVYVKDITPPPSADLSLTKSDSPDPVAVGSNLNYVLTATNAGPSDATEVSLTDDLPSTVVFASATGAACSISGQSPDGTGGSVSCSLGSMSAGTSVTVRLAVSVTASGSLTNTASVAGAENDPAVADNEATAITTVTGSSCTMIGTQLADNLTGTSGADVICGLGRSDTIHGMDGRDAVLGGNGGDALLSGDAGNDRVQGGTGNDTLVDTDGTDLLTGGAGADDLNSQDATSGDTVRGGAGTDSCTTDDGDFVTGCP
jgi:uncharacterized repeat protein (TIGR01451 family)